MEVQSVENYLLQLQLKVPKRPRNALNRNIGKRTGKLITCVGGVNDLSGLFKSSSSDSSDEEIKPAAEASPKPGSATKRARPPSPPEFLGSDDDEDFAESPSQAKNGKTDSDYISFTHNDTGKSPSEESSEFRAEDKNTQSKSFADQSTQYSASREKDVLLGRLASVTEKAEEVNMSDTPTDRRPITRTRTPRSEQQQRENMMEKDVEKSIASGRKTMVADKSKSRKSSKSRKNAASSSKSTSGLANSSVDLKTAFVGHEQQLDVQHTANNLKQPKTPDILGDYTQMINSQMEKDGTITGSLTQNASQILTPKQKRQNQIRKRLTFSGSKNRTSKSPATPRAGIKLGQDEVSPLHPVFELDAHSHASLEEFVISAAGPAQSSRWQHLSATPDVHRPSHLLKRRKSKDRDDSDGLKGPLVKSPKLDKTAPTRNQSGDHKLKNSLPRKSKKFYRIISSSSDDLDSDEPYSSPGSHSKQDVTSLQEKSQLSLKREKRTELRKFPVKNIRTSTSEKDNSPIVMKTVSKTKAVPKLKSSDKRSQHAKNTHRTVLKDSGDKADKMRKPKPSPVKSKNVRSQEQLSSLVDYSSSSGSDVEYTSIRSIRKKTFTGKKRSLPDRRASINQSYAEKDQRMEGPTPASRKHTLSQGRGNERRSASARKSRGRRKPALLLSDTTDTDAKAVKKSLHRDMKTDGTTGRGNTSGKKVWKSLVREKDSEEPMTRRSRTRKVSQKFISSEDQLSEHDTQPRKSTRSGRQPRGKKYPPKEPPVNNDNSLEKPEDESQLPSPGRSAENRTQQPLYVETASSRFQVEGSSQSMMDQRSTRSQNLSTLKKNKIAKSKAYKSRKPDLKSSGLDSWLNSHHNLTDVTTPIKVMPDPVNILQSTMINERTQARIRTQKKDVDASEMMASSHLDEHPPLPNVDESSINISLERNRLRSRLPNTFGPPASTPRASRKVKSGRVFQEEAPVHSMECDVIDVVSSDTSIQSSSNSYTESKRVSTKKRRKTPKKKGAETSVRGTRYNLRESSQTLITDSGTSPQKQSRRSLVSINQSLAVGQGVGQRSLGTNINFQESSANDVTIESNKKKRMKTKRKSKQNSSLNISEKRSSTNHKTTDGERDLEEEKLPSLEEPGSGDNTLVASVVEQHDGTLVGSPQNGGNVTIQGQKSNQKKTKGRRIREIKSSEISAGPSASPKKKSKPPKARKQAKTKQNSQKTSLNFSSRARLLDKPSASIPDIIIPVPSPEAVQRGLRRSTRVRCRPLNSYYEKLVYEPCVGGLGEIRGIKTFNEFIPIDVKNLEKSVFHNVSKSQKKADLPKKVKKKKATKPKAAKKGRKATNLGVPGPEAVTGGGRTDNDGTELQWYDSMNTAVSPRSSAQKVAPEDRSASSSRNNLSNRADEASNFDSSSTLGNKTMHITTADGSILLVDKSAIFCPAGSCTFKGPKGDLAEKDDQLKVSMGLSGGGTSQGVIILKPLTRKEERIVRTAMMCFMVHSGTVEVEVHNSREILGPGGYFRVPILNKYSLFNPDKNAEAVMHYTMVRSQEKCDVGVSTEDN